jgi:hypothetical protein
MPDWSARGCTASSPTPDTRPNARRSGSPQKAVRAMAPCPDTIHAQIHTHTHTHTHTRMRERGSPPLPRRVLTATPRRRCHGGATHHGRRVAVRCAGGSIQLHGRSVGGVDLADDERGGVAHGPIAGHADAGPAPAPRQRGHGRGLSVSWQPHVTPKPRCLKANTTRSGARLGLVCARGRCLAARKGARVCGAGGWRCPHRLPFLPPPPLLPSHTSTCAHTHTSGSDSAGP